MKEKIFRIVVAFLVLGIFFAWLDIASFGASRIDYLRFISQLFAVLGFSLIFLQFVLSAKVQIIESGFGLNNMLRYHRVFGRVGLILVTLHPIFLLVHENLITQILIFNTFRLLGLIGLLGLTVTALTALLYKKLKWSYGLWKNIHLANYVIFPILLVHAINHSVPNSVFYDLWAVFAVAYVFLLLHKLYRFMHIRRNPYTVTQVKQEAKDIWTVYMKGPRMTYKPGQFLHIQLLRDGKLSSSHPFTISSSPTEEYISITPKELGDFTSTIKETKVGDKAYLDAPYGIFSFKNVHSDTLVFIAGGIGVTPFMSMLRYIRDKKIKKDVTLIWGNKTDEMLCFETELGNLEKEIGLTLVYVMSGQRNWPGEQGRINGELIAKYVNDFKNTDFFVCGPPPMSKATIAELKKLGVQTAKIYHELFEL